MQCCAFVNAKLNFVSCLAIPCWIGHRQAKSIIKTAQFIRSEKLCVDIDFLVTFVKFLYDHLLQVFSTSYCKKKQWKNVKYFFYLLKGISITKQLRTLFNFVQLRPIADIAQNTQWKESWKKAWLKKKNLPVMLFFF